MGAAANDWPFHIHYSIIVEFDFITSPLPHLLHMCKPLVLTHLSHCVCHFLNCINYDFLFPPANIPGGPGGCPAEEDKVWKIHWPAAAPDSIQSVACPGERGTSGLDLAHRNCLDDGMWGSVVVTECESVAVRAVRMEVEQPHIYVNCMHAYTCNDYSVDHLKVSVHWSGWLELTWSLPTD